MTSKDEALDLMNEKGYKCELKNGILIFSDRCDEARKKELKKILKEIDYNYSWGVNYNEAHD